MSAMFAVDWGSELSGPFGTREEAEAWVETVVDQNWKPGVIYSWNVVPLSPPDVVPKALAHSYG